MLVICIIYLLYAGFKRYRNIIYKSVNKFTEDVEEDRCLTASHS